MDKESLLDKSDKLLLALLQEDSRITNQQLASKVNLSPAPCWRRIKRLENKGFIDRYTAILNPKMLGLNVVAYIHVSLENHHPENIREFNEFVINSPTILECSSISGNYDYLFRVIVKDVEALDIFLMKKLLKLKSIKSANTSIVLREHKSTTSLPLQVHG